MLYEKGAALLAIVLIVGITIIWIKRKLVQSFEREALDRAAKLKEALPHVAVFKDNTYGVRRKVASQSHVTYWPEKLEFLIEAPTFTVYSWADSHEGSAKFATAKEAADALARYNTWAERKYDMGERVAVEST